MPEGAVRSVGAVTGSRGSGLPSPVCGALLDGMAARASFRRRLTWALVVGGVAVACGTSSDLSVPEPGSGGGINAGGTRAVGGKARLGGFGPVSIGGAFGACRSGASCSPRTQCSAPGYDCECSSSGTYRCITRDVWGGTDSGGVANGGT